MKNFFNSLMGLRSLRLNYEQTAKTGGALLICLLLVAGAVFLGNKVAQTRQEVAQIKIDIENLERNHDQYLTLKSAFQGSVGRGSQLSQLIPTRNDILNNIRLLEGVASSTGNQQEIQIIEVAPGTKGVKAPKKTAIDPTLSSQFDKVEYTINLTGGFSNLMAYLKSLENQPFLTTVKTVSSTAETQSLGGGANRNTGLVKTKIEGVFYYIK